MAWAQNGDASAAFPHPIAPCVSASDDIWEAAAASLGDDLKAVIGPDKNNCRAILHSVHFEATQKQKQCLEKRWKIKNRKGDVIILRDVFEKIITCVNSFKGIGDSITNMGPGWAAIPWALVGMLLKVVITDNETFATMIEGLEQATRVISRYSVFEAVYLRRETAGTRLLHGSLTALYASVLTFLGESYYYFSKKAARRFIKAFFSDSGVDELLDDMTAKQTEVDRDAQLVATGVLQDAAGDIRDISSHSISVTSQLTLLNAHLERIQQAQLVVNDLQGLKDAITAASRPVQRVVVMAPHASDNLSDFHRKAMLNWLSPVPYRLQHMSERHHRLPDSGAWMFETREYVGWKESSVSATLWLHGMPGCGKTKLLSAVVDNELGEIENRPGSAPIAYFYCSRNTAEPERSDPAEVLRCIARQLCGGNASNPLPEHLRQLHDDLGSPPPGMAKLPLSRTVELILDLIRENPATIILDALDECDPGSRHELFEALDEIVAKSENVTKIFLTSRGDGDIVCRLASTPNIYISAQKNSLDIRRFIASELERVVANKQLLGGQVSDKLRQEIMDALNERADGMFRWVTLQIQNLCDPQRMRVEGDIRTELGKLPSTLADLYSIAFDQILTSGPESSKLGIRAMQILLIAFRPFAWAEFLYLVALSRDGIQPGITKAQVLHCANNFIEADPEADRVAFPHLSVRDYLATRKEFAQSTLHIAASQVCLYGIMYAAPSSLPDPRDSGYVILYLGDHLSKLSIQQRKEVDLLEQLLLDAELFMTFQNRLERIMSRNWHRYDVPQVPSLVVFHCYCPLAMICLYGLEEFVKDATLQHPETLHQPCSAKWSWHEYSSSTTMGAHFDIATAAFSLDGKSCLEMAVLRRQVKILSQLHSLRYSIGNPNDQGETILHLACSEGLDDVVRPLIAMGMDPNQRTTPPRQPRKDYLPLRGYLGYDDKSPPDPISYRPASSLGFRSRDTQELGLISPFGGPDTELQYPIHLAIAPGKSIACVRALVEAGADSNVRTTRGATALQLSFEMGDETEEIVKLLLDRGADPNAQLTTFGRTMLHLAAAMGLAKIVPILVAAGAEVAQRDHFGQTPWDIAVRYGHTEIATVLAAAREPPLNNTLHSEMEGRDALGWTAVTPAPAPWNEEGLLPSSKQPTVATSYIPELPAIEVQLPMEEKSPSKRIDRVRREWRKLKMKIR